jgi:hypothetical protein
LEIFIEQIDPSEKTVSVTGKIFKREGNERLAEINRESAAPAICIDCAYNESMSGKVSSSSSSIDDSR